MAQEPSHRILSGPPSNGFLFLPRALASGYHCLVAPYYPEKASALSAGSIIRVSSTGPDKCVTGIYEGQVRGWTVSLDG